MPVTKYSGIILDRGLHARFNHLDGFWRIIDAAKKTGRITSCAEFEILGNGPNVVEVCLDSVESSKGQRLLKSFYRTVASRPANDDFRQHGVIERRDLGSALDPCFAACDRRQLNVAQNSGARAKAV